MYSWRKPALLFACYLWNSSKDSECFRQACSLLNCLICKDCRSCSDAAGFWVFVFVYVCLFMCLCLSIVFVYVCLFQAERLEALCAEVAERQSQLAQQLGGGSGQLQPLQARCQQLHGQLQEQAARTRQMAAEHEEYDARRAALLQWIEQAQQQLQDNRCNTGRQDQRGRGGGRVLGMVVMCRCLGGDILWQGQ